MQFLDQKYSTLLEFLHTFSVKVGTFVYIFNFDRYDFTSFFGRKICFDFAFHNPKSGNLQNSAYFFRQIFITYIDPIITYDVMVSEMRDTCGFPRTYPFTIKWVDEDGDPCTISSQRELSEAIRLYEVNKEAELTVHGKPGIIRIYF